MRETRQSGSEGGEAESLPYPYHPRVASNACQRVYFPSRVDGWVKPIQDGVKSRRPRLLV